MTPGKTERGATMTEYAIIVALIGLAVIASLLVINDELRATLTGVVPKCTGAETGDHMCVN